MWTLIIVVIGFLLFTAANSDAGRPWINEHLGIDMSQVKSTIMKSLASLSR